jgi:16S rRNA (guanine527-N7)-methyltransferase
MRPPDLQASGLRGALAEVGRTLALDLAETQLDTLLAYLALLQRWNTTYNLTAVRDPAQMLTQHLADCLAVIDPLRQHCGTDSSKRVLDVGSGGGLPGIVIAALNPGIEVTCVDTVGKKAAFIRQAAGELGLKNLFAEHARVEQLKAAPFDVIVSRAFASLDDFTRLTRQHLAPNGVWAAMKGKTPDDEMAQLPADFAVFHVEHLAVPGLQAERCLVWIRPQTPSL